MATDRVGRLGVGLSNQYKVGIPAISFKLQKSRAFSFGGMVAFSNDDNGGYGAGLKVFRNIFDEPQLNFYTAVLGAVIQQKQANAEDQSGFQFDFTLGAEYSFSGLQSLGFSTEFGLSLNKLEDFVVETTGSSFIVVAVHFFL